MSKKNFYTVLIIILSVFVATLVLHDVSRKNADTTQPSSETSSEEIKAAHVISDDLEIPWDIAFLPDASMLVTERDGRLLRVSKDGSVETIASNLSRSAGESGLLGITLHPNFESNRYVYLYKTQSGQTGTTNTVIRSVYQNNSLSDETIILENIPGALYHDGGRIEFGPDGKLYVATGDATRTDYAESINSLAGKILRVNDDGSIPDDNPFKGSPVYSYGHRNPQGLAWDSDGRLWSTEHGRSGSNSGFDEINLIQAGGNYGWPNSEGDIVGVGTVGPVLHSGLRDTWAPASAAIQGSYLYFGGLRGEALFRATINNGTITDLSNFFFEKFGRIRTVRVGPDGMLYITTSNQDGRGNPEIDDKIIRIDPDGLE